MSTDVVDQNAAPNQRLESGFAQPVDMQDRHSKWQAEQMRLFWTQRRLLRRAVGIGLIVSTVIAFTIPKSYTATTRLMPPDARSTSGMAMIAAMASKGGNALGGIADDLLGLESSGALFVGILRSQTSQDRLVQEFDLRKVYRKKLEEDARTQLDDGTIIIEDRKSGIIAISVTDHSPERAAALANSYVLQLNSLVANLSTSAAHRERLFLEGRLKVVKQDLDNASNQLAQFSSKNNTLDLVQQGKATLDATASLAGQMIAAQSELDGLKQIYTDEYPRVRVLNARVAELREQLDKLSGSTGSGADSSVVNSSDTSEATTGDVPYPSIRKLPLLGVKFEDYYRRAKTEETVFELLTEQDELAKVEEAKETPSVKVLDPARIPQRKSYPPRLIIMTLGTLFSFLAAVAWVFALSSWNNMDSQDPRKGVMDELVRSIDVQGRWAHVGVLARSTLRMVNARFRTGRRTAAEPSAD